MFKRFYAFLLLRISHFYFKRGNFSKGMAILERIVTFAPKYHFAYFHTGCKWIEKKEFAKAKESFAKALEYKPQSPLYHTFFGIALYEEGLFSEAEKRFNVSLGFDPNNQMTYNYLAICYLAQGNTDAFKKLLSEKGVFENTDCQIRLLLAMEKYLRKNIKKNESTEPNTQRLQSD